MADKMKVNVTLVIEVDPKVWADADGTPGVWKAGGYSAAGVRQSIKDHVFYMVQQSYRIEETDAEVTLK